MRLCKENALTMPGKSYMWTTIKPYSERLILRDKRIPFSSALVPQTVCRLRNLALAVKFRAPNTCSSILRGRNGAHRIPDGSNETRFDDVQRALQLRQLAPTQRWGKPDNSVDDLELVVLRATHRNPTKEELRSNMGRFCACNCPGPPQSIEPGRCLGRGVKGLSEWFRAGSDLPNL